MIFSNQERLGESFAPSRPWIFDMLPKLSTDQLKCLFRMRLSNPVGSGSSVPLLETSKEVVSTTE